MVLYHLTPSIAGTKLFAILLFPTNLVLMMKLGDGGVAKTLGFFGR